MTADEKLSKAAAALIASLGDKPGKIARNIYERGVRGYRMVAYDCPLANLFVMELNADYAEVRVVRTKAGPDFWTYPPSELYIERGGAVVTVKLPKAVQLFHLNFYCGKYPSLVTGHGEPEDDDYG